MACANPPHIAKIICASGVNGVAAVATALSARGRTIRRIAGTSAAPSAFLISDAAMNGAIADQPRLFDTEFHAERQPAKSGGENEDVSERHRHEQPQHRSIPAALAQPARDKGRRHEAVEISGRRTDAAARGRRRDLRTPAIRSRLRPDRPSRLRCRAASHRRRRSSARPASAASSAHRATAD